MVQKDMRYVTIYRNPETYSAFPFVEWLDNGDAVVSFREAGGASARVAKEGCVTHLDADADSILVRSTDGGETWDPATKVTIHEDSRDQSDVAIKQLRDGTLLANFFCWRCYESEAEGQKHGAGVFREEFGYFVTEGPYVVRSWDRGHSWEVTPIPVYVPPYIHETRDAVVELDDGTLVMALDGGGDAATVRSHDGGETWTEVALVTGNPRRQSYLSTRLNFAEPGIFAAGGQRLIMLLRTEQTHAGGGWLYQTESNDGGLSWSPPSSTNIWGYPAHMLRLKDGRILATYGYRKEAMGVRGCFSHDEGKTWDVEHEIVFRDDARHRDLGYPASVQRPDGSILTVYYMNDEEAVRYIEGVIWRAP